MLARKLLAGAMGRMERVLALVRRRLTVSQARRNERKTDAGTALRCIATDAQL